MNVFDINHDEIYRQKELPLFNVRGLRLCGCCKQDMTTKDRFIGLWTCYNPMCKWGQHNEFVLENGGTLVYLGGGKI